MGSSPTFAAVQRATYGWSFVVLVRSIEEMRDFIRRLPASTNAWMCPYFLLIAFFSAYATGVALLSPSVADTYAILPGLMLVGVLLMRRSNRECHVP